ncbi:hypothetical protein [Nonomuraea turcica]|uniref:hypothetical protein n=1 Tax=Nonomuraea sp. G32 TaxID=3067274 RepID=UPI00273B47BE|nr:hypothetical protein [Nonomuraea sp. G32]MDP4511234.1 hypothetical protein [Nonomuraea sp. G32]
MKAINGAMRLLAVAWLVVLSLPAPARAHVVQAGADLRVTQTFETGEVTLVIAGLSQVPAALRVAAEAADPASLQLELRSLTDGSRSSGSASVGQDPAALWVTHTGPHELRVRVGDEVSMIPFRVLVPESAPWTMVMDGAFLVTGLLLVGGVLAKSMSRLLMSGASAAGAVAVTVMLLGPYLPPAQPEGSAPQAESGRPYAQGSFSTQPARPVTGAEFTLILRLADGATGRPVDDLAVHHEAPAHLVVTSENGVIFRHVHPLRTAPGVLAVRLSLPYPGRYLAYAEIERQQSGGQLLTGAFEVSGTAQPDASVQEVAMPSLTPPAPVAGSPVTIEVATEGQIQLWLGMPGHMVVRSRDGAHLAHAHGTAAGPSALRFTLTLPEPGRYLAWVQYAAGGRLLTRPFTMEVDR